MFTARKTTAIEQDASADTAQAQETTSLNVEMTRAPGVVEHGTLPDLYEDPDVRCITPSENSVVVVTGHSVKLFR